MVILKIIVWSLFQIFLFLLGFFLQKSNNELKLLNQLNYSVYVSRGAGLVIAVDISLLLLPVCRRLNLDKYYFTIQFHVMCACSVLTFVVIHVYSHYLNFYRVQNVINLNTMVNTHYTTFAGITGHIMLFSLFWIFIFSGNFFRVKQYNTFWYSHHFFVLFFVCYIMHSVGCFVKTSSNACLPYYSNVLVSIPLLVYAFERIVREFRPIQNARYFTILSDDVVKISFINPFKYKSGQYILLRCLNISKFEWHPFSITSNEHDLYLEIAVKSTGDWTTNLIEKLKNKEKMFYQIDGPYSSSADLLYTKKYDALLFIASGIGITPYIGILRKLMIDYYQDQLMYSKIDIIWVNRNIESFSWFDVEMNQIKMINNILRIHKYLTQFNKESEFDDEIHIGRPNFDRIFKEYTKNNSNYKVGCFVCCNEQIFTKINESIDKYSNKDITFEVHKEKFL